MEEEEASVLEVAEAGIWDNPQGQCRTSTNPCCRDHHLCQGSWRRSNPIWTSSSLEHYL